MMGMLAAVEAWVKRDHVEKMKTWNLYLETISKRLSSVKGVTCSVREPRGLSNHSPSLVISWDPTDLNTNGMDVAEELATKQPRIAVHNNYLDESGKTSITLSSGQMQPGNDKIVGDRIYEILSRKNPKPKEMSAPVASLAGRWDVDIEFYSSKSQHSFFIEQDGNWIKGSHKGEFSLREMYGIIDGDQIKLSSSERLLADNVPFVFYGTATADKIEGQIYMGEYIAAKFIAKRHETRQNNRPIRVPKGQPLAT
jgi:hypothetical protein